ncbi:MAG: hypothetical protein ACE5JN_01430 [Candidatus Methylomirabilia bacterium]
MSLAQKLERLARIVPGVAGYQDRGRSRDTDKAIRLRLTTELGQVKRDLEEDKRRLMEKKDLSLLPALDRVAAKLDKLGNTIKYASRGYRGLFDTYKLDQKKLDELYTFDLGLFEELGSVKSQAKRVRDSHPNSETVKNATEELDRALDSFENTFSRRQDTLTAE